MSVKFLKVEGGSPSPLHCPSEASSGVQRQMQGPAHGEEQPHASVPAWGGHTGEQLCGEGRGCPSGRQVNHEPVVCPGCQEGQWHSGMH